MDEGVLYLIAADGVLFAHALFVGFVVVGLLLVVVGKLRDWAWVRSPWFRYAHLAAIAVVVLQSWLGAICPLTTWEMALREKAGESVYSGAFVAHWLESILYYRAPQWVFVVCYTIFGALVAATWYWVRPRRFFEGGVHGAAEHERQAASPIMRLACSILLIAVGLMNLIPVIGVISADQLTRLYGIGIDSADLETLLRHRAVMLGLIGGFLLLAAFRSSLQVLAGLIGLVSMSSFVVLAYLSGENGAQIHRVVVADIVGSVAAAAALVIAIRERRNVE